MIEAFVMQHIIKFTIVGLGLACVGLHATKQPKKLSDYDILLKKLIEIEERINNRGF